MLLGSLNYALALGVGVTFPARGTGCGAQLHTFRNLAGIEITPLSAGETFAGGSIPFALGAACGIGSAHRHPRARRQRAGRAATSPRDKR
jgi:hypothetical protein